MACWLEYGGHFHTPLCLLPNHPNSSSKVQTLCTDPHCCQSKFYMLIKVWSHNLEGDKGHLCLREPVQNKSSSLPASGPWKGGIWLYRSCGVLPHSQAPGSGGLAPFQRCCPGLWIPPIRVLSQKERHLSHNCSPPEHLQPQGTTQPFFPVISVANALVFPCH